MANLGAVLTVAELAMRAVGKVVDLPGEKPSKDCMLMKAGRTFENFGFRPLRERNISQEMGPPTTEESQVTEGESKINETGQLVKNLFVMVGISVLGTCLARFAGVPPTTFNKLMLPASWISPLLERVLPYFRQ
jgi:hypothetical protein